VTMKSPVCGRHFDPADILVDYKTTMPDGTVHIIPRGRPALKPTAVPKIFDGPKYLSANLKPKRKEPKERKPFTEKNCNSETNGKLSKLVSLKWDNVRIFF